MWQSMFRHMAARSSMPDPVERMSPDMAELWSRVRSGHREGHYCVALFGLRRYDPVYVVAQIERGLTYSAFERFLKNTELSYQSVAKFAEIPERTLARRK